MVWCNNAPNNFLEIDIETSEKTLIVVSDVQIMFEHDVNEH